jgi:hypothetical protein
MNYAQALYDNFCQFIRHVDFADLPDNHYNEDAFDQYLLCWLEHGNAVLQSRTEFGAYMMGVVYIINRWMHDPEIVDYAGTKLGLAKPARQRRPQCLSDDSAYIAKAFRRDYFEFVTYRNIQSARASQKS